MAGEAELTRRLAAAGFGAVRVTRIDRGADPGDAPRAEITITRHTLESYDAMPASSPVSCWTSWEEALALATEDLSAEVADALEQAMTEAPEKVSPALRRRLAGDGRTRRRSVDGRVDFLVPAARRRAVVEGAAGAARGGGRAPEHDEDAPRAAAALGQRGANASRRRS